MLNDIMVTIRENMEIQFDLKINEPCTAEKWKCNLFQIGSNRLYEYSFPQIALLNDSRGYIEILYSDADDVYSNFLVGDDATIDTMSDGN